MPSGNGRQGHLYSNTRNVQSAVSHSQTTFQNQIFGSPIPSTPHSAPAAAESLAPHFVYQAKPKVTQVNKTAVSAPIIPQFTVKSSCTSAELRGQVFHQTAVIGCNTGGLIGNNATAGSVSALRHIHSGQMN